MNPGTITIIVLLLGIAGLLIVLLRKVRAVHLATYRLLDDAQATRRESEALFSQLQALWTLERKLGLPEALPPLRGWAGSPDFLLALANEVEALRPGVVVECSSGSSTLVIARCLQRIGAGHVYSLEHEPEYAAKTRALLARHGLSQWGTVLDAPLRSQGSAQPWYDDSVLPADLPPVDLLVIDGPPEATAPRAREPALTRMGPRLAAHCVVLADDADRPDEREMVRRWIEAQPHWRLSRLSAEKGLARLERV